jgi:hypothetical protein
VYVVKVVYNSTGGISLDEKSLRSKRYMLYRVMFREKVYLVKRNISNDYRWSGYVSFVISK